MGVPKVSKNQVFVARKTKNVQAKSKLKGKDKRNTKFKPNEDVDQLDGSSGSKKEKILRFYNGKFSYCKKGNHIEKGCMNKTIDHMSILLEQHNVFLPKGTKKVHYGGNTKYHEIFHAMKDGF